MSNPQFAAEQLLELLLQLKKTTPTAARGILNGQPQIAYALITLMVNMNAINVEVFQKVLAEYSKQGQPTAASSAPVASSAHPTVSSTPVSAIPPHLQQQNHRTSTPPIAPATTAQPSQSQYQSNPNGWNQHPTSYPQTYPSTSGSNTYNQPPGGYSYNAPNAYATPAPPPATPTQPNPEVLASMLAAMPDDQKQLIMRVITMTSEQIHALPAAERQAYIQLRATLGVPT